MTDSDIATGTAGSTLESGRMDRNPDADRMSADYAATIFQRLVPEPELRSRAQRLLANDCVTAHRENPASWCLSIDPQGPLINLKVGPLLAIRMRRSGISFLMPRSISPRAQRIIDGLQESYEFRQYPGFKFYVGSSEQVLSGWDDVVSDHHSAIQQVASHVKRSNTFASHATGLALHLSQVTGITVPVPDHLSQGIPATRIDALLTLMNQKFPGWTGFDDERFLKEESNYKREASQLAQELLNKRELRRLLDAGDHAEIVARLQKVSKHTNLLWLQMPSQGDTAVLYAENLDKSTFCAELYELLHGDQDLLSRFERFVQWHKEAKLPCKWTFPTYFLFLLYPESEMFVKPETTTSATRLLGFPQKYWGEPTPEKYEHIRNLSTALAAELTDRGYPTHDMIDVQGLLWVCAQQQKSANTGDEKIQYWKISPGSDGKIWSRFLKEGAAMIGWKELGDLSSCDRDGFRARAEQIRKQHPQWSMARLMQVWQFAQIQPGDRIVANRGTSQVLGIGTVVGPYRFLPGEEYAHQIDVRWDVTEAFAVSQPGWRKTLVKLAKSDFTEIEERAAVGKSSGAASPKQPGIIADPAELDTAAESTEAASRHPAPADAVEAHPTYSLETCAEETGFDALLLQRWIRAIHRKGQAIFYGPPGTGKTFLADKLARHLVGGGTGSIETVQFHPSYSYEDFVQGIRPSIDGRALAYEMADGRFLEFCQKARRSSDLSVLIIDEINRANLSRVFGELMYLLEYRNKQIPLAGGSGLSIPGNVRIIGTMNTADRSIALVDHALRRRFAFIELQPDYDVMKHYHVSRTTGFPIDNLCRLLKELNRDIDDPHHSVGVSFFLRENLAQEIEDIWRQEIFPYLEECFFDRPERLNKYRWDEVSARFEG